MRKITIGKQYLFDVLGKLPESSNVKTVTVIKKKIFSDKYYCLSDDNSKVFIVSSKYLTPINKNQYPILINRQTNVIRFDQSDADFLDTLYSYICKLEVTNKNDTIMNMVKAGLSILIAKVNLIVENDEENRCEVIQRNMDSIQDMEDIDDKPINNITKLLKEKDISDGINDCLCTISETLIMEDTDDKFIDVFKEKFPYRLIEFDISNPETSYLDKEIIEQMCESLAESFENKGVDMCFIPSIFYDSDDKNKYYCLKEKYSCFVIRKENYDEKIKTILNNLYTQYKLPNKNVAVLPFKIIPFELSYNTGENEEEEYEDE